MQYPKRKSATSGVAESNAVIGQVAEECGAAYLPVHERQATYLREHGRTRGRTYDDRSTLLVMAAASAHYLLGRSFDEVSERLGLAMTTDPIHLNSISAELVVEEVERFLASADFSAPPPAPH
jgi:acyl-CoA thioesterase I